MTRGIVGPGDFEHLKRYWFPRVVGNEVHDGYFSLRRGISGPDYIEYFDKFETSHYCDGEVSCFEAVTYDIRNDERTLHLAGLASCNSLLQTFDKDRLISITFEPQWKDARTGELYPVIKGPLVETRYSDYPWGWLYPGFPDKATEPKSPSIDIDEIERIARSVTTTRGRSRYR